MEYGRCMEGVAMRGVAIGGGVVSEHPRNLCIQKKKDMYCLGAQHGLSSFVFRWRVTPPKIKIYFWVHHYD